MERIISDFTIGTQIRLGSIKEEKVKTGNKAGVINEHGSKTGEYSKKSWEK